MYLTGALLRLLIILSMAIVSNQCVPTFPSRPPDHNRPPDVSSPSAPEASQSRRERYAAWKERLMRAYVGDQLVDLLGVDALVNLDRDGGLWDFITDQSYQGQPLSDRLGGWLEVAASFRGREMVCYHKEWSYFGRAFQIPCIEFIEPKPGIPPTPRHVAKVIALMRERQVPVLFSTNYFDRGQVEMVARRTGATAVIVPSNVGGAPNTDTYIDLVSLWVTRLAEAFGERGSAGPSGGR